MRFCTSATVITRSPTRAIGSPAAPGGRRPSGWTTAGPAGWPGRRGRGDHQHEHERSSCSSLSSLWGRQQKPRHFGRAVGAWDRRAPRLRARPSRELLGSEDLAGQLLDRLRSVMDDGRETTAAVALPGRDIDLDPDRFAIVSQVSWSGLTFAVRLPASGPLARSLATCWSRSPACGLASTARASPSPAGACWKSAREPGWAPAGTAEIAQDGDGTCGALRAGKVRRRRPAPPGAAMSTARVSMTWPSGQSGRRESGRACRATRSAWT